MLIFLCQGGESTITVTAPSGSQLSLSGGGESFNYTLQSGETSKAFNVHTIASWTVSCTYQSREISKTVSITSFGASESVSFSYATLTVNTYPGASITISKSGSSPQNKTATGGSALFYLTEEEFDSSTPWTASCSYTSGSTWSNSGTKLITAATSYSLSVSLSVPVFSFSWNGGSASFTESSPTSSTSQYYYYRNGANWEFYAKVGGTLSFSNNTYVDIFLCGAGSNGGAGSAGGNSWYDEYAHVTYYQGTYCNGGAAGLGGARKKLSEVLNGSFSVVCGASNGANSTLGSYTSSGGTRSGESANGGYSFDDSTAKGPDGNSRRVGAGGGAGCSSTRNGGGGTTPATGGGDYGGGSGGAADASGGNEYAQAGSNAMPGSYGAGGGGGGAWCNMAQSTHKLWGDAAGGSGTKGFVAVRNKR